MVIRLYYGNSFPITKKGLLLSAAAIKTHRVSRDTKT